MDEARLRQRRRILYGLVGVFWVVAVGNYVAFKMGWRHDLLLVTIAAKVVFLVAFVITAEMIWRLRGPGQRVRQIMAEAEVEGAKLRARLRDE